MNIIKTDIEGVLMIEPNLFRDDRGNFLESFNEREFNDKISPIIGHKINFCQDNESMSFMECYEACTFSVHRTLKVSWFVA